MIINHIMETGTCQGLPSMMVGAKDSDGLGIPDHIRETFVVSQDISAEEHVRTQAAMQAFVDNSLSKTINFPDDATVDEVATAYQLAWELGCKGITVYVTGSRHKVVLETHATAKGKQLTAELEASDVSVEQLPMWDEAKKPRPRRLPGYTISVETPLGKTFVTINENGGGRP